MNNISFLCYKTHRITNKHSLQFYNPEKTGINNIYLHDYCHPRKWEYSSKKEGIYNSKIYINLILCYLYIHILFKI